MKRLHVATTLFEGPLDLLVQLVRGHEIDPVDIMLAEIALRYLEHLRHEAASDLDEIGDFIEFVTLLMEWKSDRLIPKPAPTERPVEEPADSHVVKHLLEYRRFKEAAVLLTERARTRRQMLARSTIEAPNEANSEQALASGELELWDLVSAFSRIVRQNVVPVLEHVPRDPTPIPVYMDHLGQLIQSANGIGLEQLLGLGNTREQLIGKFLALLELIKCQRAWIEFEPSTDSIAVYAAPPVRNVEGAGRVVPIAMEDENVPPDQLPQTDLQPKTNSAWDDFEPFTRPPANGP